MIKNRKIKLVLRILRRSHLYLGLALIPWVFLYGITAYLFNHPGHFSPVDVETVSRTLIPMDWPTRNWKPDARAEEVVRQLNARFSADEKKIRLDTSKPSRFESSGLIASFDRGNTTYSYSIPLSGTQAGVLRKAPKANIAPQTGKAFFEISPKKNAPTTKPQSPAVEPASVETATREPDANQMPLLLEDGLVELLKTQVASIANRNEKSIDVQASEVRVSFLPSLLFQANVDGEVWECKHDALSGAVSTKRLDSEAMSPFSWRQFWLRLHTTHGYHPDGGTRWLWAIVVDIMAAVMVFWGISGLAMWWQMKATRRWGGIAISVGFLIAIWLGYGMYQWMR
ncbi:MAG: hypothetical protein MUD03_08265 [Pirellula sp.]|jgi:hypothetical protein|nr:hypothetical protein [Pirellula sp.]